MKILLDENLPHDLRYHLHGHDVFTVAYQRWNGIQNGKLLALAAADGFEVILTLDNGVAYQQNIATLPIAVMILSARSNDIADLLPLVPTILQELTSASVQRVVRIA